MSALKIRIGFVLHVMQVAGAEVLVERMIQSLADAIEPTVFCLDSIGTIGERLQAAGVPVVVLGRRPGIDWSLVGRLAREVRSRRIEILHAHQYTPLFYSALARLRGAKAKVMFTEHGRHYPDVVSSKRRWINRLLLSRLVDQSTACCEFSAKAVREIDGFGHCDVLPNGVPLENLPARGDSLEQDRLRRKLGLDLERPYVACIARFHPVKDHATLLRAWPEVIQRSRKRVVAGHLGRSPGDNGRPQTPSGHAPVADQPLDPKLLLAGDGPERERLQQMCRELEIAGSVDFLGVRDDVAEILRCVDLFTLTSVSEAASLTLLEAMASECPAVVTDVGGNAEHLTDGVEGHLVPRGDHQALALAISNLLSNPEHASNLGRAARQRVIENFDLGTAVQKYHERYRQLVGR